MKYNTKLEGKQLYSKGGLVSLILLFSGSIMMGITAVMWSGVLFIIGIIFNSTGGLIGLISLVVFITRISDVEKINLIEVPITQNVNRYNSRTHNMSSYCSMCGNHAEYNQIYCKSCGSILE